MKKNTKMDKIRQEKKKKKRNGWQFKWRLTLPNALYLRTS